jgi:hypothetical protein
VTAQLPWSLFTQLNKYPGEDLIAMMAIVNHKGIHTLALHAAMKK